MFTCMTYHLNKLKRNEAHFRPAFQTGGKGKLPHEDVKQIYQRLSPSAALDEAREAFLIIEAAVEQMDVKRHFHAA